MMIWSLFLSSFATAILLGDVAVGGLGVHCPVNEAKYKANVPKLLKTGLAPLFAPLVHQSGLRTPEIPPHVQEPLFPHKLQTLW